jgi:hypothetical protein
VFEDFFIIYHERKFILLAEKLLEG